jgi:hypothetical protein
LPKPGPSKLLNCKQPNLRPLSCRSLGKKAIKLRLRGCFALRSTWCRGYSTPIGMRPALLTESAIFYRSAAERGRVARLTLIAAPLILVLTGCSASSPFSGQANKPSPNQAAGVAPIPNAAAISPAQQDYADSLPYPKQSLADVFRDSTQTPAQSQIQTVPHPPSTYTPSGQPYSPPPGQQSNGVSPAPSATAAATPPANPDPTDSLPYPKQSLIDLFSNK